MSATTLARPVAATVLPGGADARHVDRPATSDLRHALVRLALVGLSVAVAFHFSLVTLLRSWQYDSPVGDLALVPFVAAGLAVAAVHRHEFVATSRLGRLDLLVAAAAVLPVAVALVVLPALVGNYYWAMRLDLLVLPLLAVAGIALLFGTRAVLGFVFPLSLLLLAWPLPFTTALAPLQSVLTDLTGRAVLLVLQVAPLATQVDSGADLRLQVGGARPFEATVASACSGVDGVIGFVVVGTATMYALRGPLVRRLGWFAAGLLAVWLSNVLRVLSILVVGRAFGPEVAFDVLHPVAGLVLLNLTFLALLWAVPRFGLERRPLFRRSVSDVPLVQPLPDARPPRWQRLVPRVALLLLVAVGLGVADQSLTGTSHAYDNTGLPSAVPFSADTRAGDGVTATQLPTQDWGRAFGSGVGWDRYVLRPDDPSTGYTMWLDTITSEHLDALATRPVEECYTFHRFDLPVRQRLVLGSGVVAQRFVYRRPDGAEWHTVTWDWPVSGPDGEVRYERVVLLASSLRRVDVADLPQARTDGAPLRAAAVKVLDRSQSTADTNPALTTALMAQANRLVLLHEKAAARDTGDARS